LPFSFNALILRVIHFPRFQPQELTFPEKFQFYYFIIFYYLWERFYAHIGIAILFGEGIYILARECG
jgi:hypothetical protein